MRVAELIAFLNKQHPDARVVVDGYEGGYDNIGIHGTIRIEPNDDREADADDEDYFGRFVDAERAGEVAVYLSRSPEKHPDGAESVHSDSSKA